MNITYKHAKTFQEEYLRRAASQGKPTPKAHPIQQRLIISLADTMLLLGQRLKQSAQAI